MLSKQIPLGIYEKALPAGECWLERLQTGDARKNEGRNSWVTGRRKARSGSTSGHRKGTAEAEVSGSLLFQLLNLFRHTYLNFAQRA
ncbi:hypothetical protein NE615_26745, partial [Escherichia coli]|nr:hypothetical protein [Escherichia coli]